jgi:small basic protein
MNYALPIFLAVAASLAIAGILTVALQFFADGWQLPARNKLAALPPEIRARREKQIPIVFVVGFFFVLLMLALLWHIGATP